MKKSHLLFIAFRYLKSKKRHRTISINTLISFAGISLGVMALLLVLSIMTGYKETIQEKILGVNTHIIVLRYGGKIHEYNDVIEKIINVKGVSAASPLLMGQVMLSHDKNSYGVFFRGVDIRSEKSTTVIHKHMDTGNFDAIAEDGEIPGILLGRELALKLGVSINDTLNVISPVGERGPLGMLPRSKKFTVVGIFDIGMYEYDANLAIASLRSVQDFFHMQNRINAIEVRIDDIYAAPQIKKAIQSVVGARFYARDWMEMNRNLFSSLKLQKFVFFIILTLIILVAAFNIASTLIMNVLEKEREIAILKTMGTTNRGIMSIFMIQGLLIGFAGTLIGISMAYITGYLINSYDLIKLPADIYYLGNLTARMKLSDFIIVSISAIIISFISTLYPAWKASRINPIEPLRYE